uniref:INO80 complex subunit F domain-containing protein n=1 Tax=Taeniopygia guttata TaxID=59729 RepID=A0A674H5Q2_TAEGU
MFGVNFGRFSGMAGVSFEEFSAPPGAELALEPLFGGNILESEGEPEAGPEGGGAGGEDSPELRRRRMKLQALGRRCREIRQVNARALQRLRQVQRETRRMRLERRFLMQVLDAHGDRYRGVPQGGSPPLPPRERRERTPRGGPPRPSPTAPQNPPGAPRAQTAPPRPPGGAQGGTPKPPQTPKGPTEPPWGGHPGKGGVWGSRGTVLG